LSWAREEDEEGETREEEEDGVEEGEEEEAKEVLASETGF
jgi:hypothetical protein